jgi:superoxide dismutase, Fe-Mn family
MIKEVSAMPYVARDYSKLIGMQGFSETLLKNHFTLYQGYVMNTNKVLDALDRMLMENKTSAPEYAELKRRLGWEFNGMRLHELYFDNLGGRSPLNKNSKLAQRLIDNFGNIDNWEKDFKATGSMRGIGWCALYQDTTDGRLINFWINEHDVSHPAGCNPLLIMDVFEHAYLTDYGLKRTDYIESFMINVNWSMVENRLEQFERVMRKVG